MQISFYVSEDYPAGGTWSVYSEMYESPDHDEPINGSQKLVLAGLPSEALADKARDILDREAPRFIILEHPFT